MLRGVGILSTAITTFDLLLSAFQVITVEPGCYFIDALLIPARDDPISSKFFNWEEIEKYKSFGGVRIESDVVCLGCPFPLLKYKLRNMIQNLVGS